MKSLPLLFVLCLSASFISFKPNYPPKALVLICQGNEEFSRDNPRAAEVICLREEMSSLIKEGNYPIVIECDRNVAWLYLNDPLGRNYPEVDFESDYFDIIMDLFPLKINKNLRKSLRQGNKQFLETLGIEYFVENGEVISKIDYDKFERFVF